MPPEIRIINPIHYPEWEFLIRDGEGAVFSNTAAWARTLCEAYHYTPLYFSMFEDNRLSALIPVIEVRSRLTGLRGVSLPFTDCCMPIIHNEDSFRYLFNYIVLCGQARGWKYFELRAGVPYLKDKDPAVTYFAHELCLAHDGEELYSRFRESTKRNVRRAMEKGVTVRFCTSSEAMTEYYKLHCITRKRHHIPPQPLTFFQKMQKNIISGGQGYILLAEYQDRVVAGAVFFHFGRNASFKYGASDMRYQKVRANNLIMWEAIKHYSHHGYERLCFGRTDRDNHGLRQYKLGWGASESIIKYHIYDLKKNVFVKDSRKILPLYKIAFSKMPLSLLRLSGRLLYRHIG